MSLRSICFAVCDEIGWTRPTQIAASTEALGRQLLALAKRELEFISSERDWPVLLRTHDFDTVAAQDEYDLPDDYDKILSASVYNSDSYYRLRGSVSPSEWAQRKYAMLNSIDRYSFRLIGNPLKLVITPTPTLVESLTYEYKTNMRAATDAGVEKTQYEIDTDVPLVHEKLVQQGLLWRAKRAKGLAYDEEYVEYQNVVKTRYAQDLVSGVINIGGKPYGSDVVTTGSIPENGFGS